MCMSCRSTYSLKWCYDWFMCFVRGRIFGIRANSKAPLLSSKTVQWIFGGTSLILTPCSTASLSMPISGITSLRLVDKAIYSASVVDNAVIVCILDAHMISAPAKRIIHPERDLAVIGSLLASCGRQLPEKSASTQHSKYLSSFGRMMSPLSFVANK